MEIAIISDLHLGVRGSWADDFGNKEWLLRRFVERNDGKFLIALGDVFELWQFGLEEILSSRPQIPSILSEFDLIVRGNHDWSLPDTMFGVPVRNEKLLGDTYLTHGHQFDLFCHGWLQWVGRTASNMAGLGERYVNADFDDMVSGFGRSLQRIFATAHHTKKERFRVYARKFLERNPRYSTVVLGHTHKKDSVDSWYYNTGSWIGSNNDQVYLGVNHA